MPTGLRVIPNSVKTVSKQCQTATFLRSRYRPLQQNTELHQKDLRINLELVHILGMVHEAVSRADMFLALSLIVDISWSHGSH